MCLVQVLGLHFRRVQWTAAGRQIKVPGHISFPATLPAAALEAAVPGTRGKSTDGLPPLALPAELRGAQPQQSPQLPHTAEPDQNFPMAATSHRPDVSPLHEPLLDAGSYTLTAVVQHHGGPESGHYTTLRRIATVRSNCSIHHAEHCCSLSAAWRNPGAHRTQCHMQCCRLSACLPNQADLLPLPMQAADGAPLWFSTSDASVRRASEEEALDADEATLLLYCRNACCSYD